jgi:hypothetical protein
MPDQNAPELSRGSDRMNSDRINVAFWNLQNLFDLEVSPIAAELEYSPVCGWDRHALDAKIRAIADVIRQMFDGRGPDLLGICEIESERVAQRLIREIGRSDYRLAHVDQSDITGLDTSLIYSDQVFRLADQWPPRGHNVTHRFPTRDIFEVSLKVLANDSDLVVLVNHWPSRKSGRVASEPHRITVAAHCARLVEKHLKVSRREYLELRDNEVSLFRLNQVWDSSVLVMGDFNDDPWNISLLEILRAGFSAEHLEESIRFVRGTLPSWKIYSERPAWLFNPMWSLLGKPDQGTACNTESAHPLRLSDQFLISRGLYFGQQGLIMPQQSPGIPAVNIFRPEVMVTRRGRPREFRRETRTGCSDHFPITTELQVLR